jgi:DNA-binding IclR family transcriptional regulator
VAAPVCDRSGSVVAAVSVAGPTHRLTDARLKALAPAARAAAAEISRRLGYAPGDDASYPT